MDIIEDGLITPVAKIGQHRSGNYAEFEGDGTLAFKGDATVWRDIDFPIIARTSQAGQPSPTTLIGNLTAPAWAVNDFSMCEGQEIVHSWLEGSPWYWHIHLFTGGTEAVDKFVRFQLEFAYASFEQVLSAVTTIVGEDLLIPADRPDRFHSIYSLGAFAPPLNTKIATQVYARLTRIASVGTAPVANPFVPMLQIHVKCDTIGSRNMTEK